MPSARRRRARSLTRASTRRWKSKTSSTARSPTRWAFPARKSSCPATPTNPFCSIASASSASSQMPPLARNLVDTNAVAVIAHGFNRCRPFPPRCRRGLDARGHRQRRAWPATPVILNGRFNLIASGSDIWDTADAFHFACTPIDRRRPDRRARHFHAIHRPVGEGRRDVPRKSFRPARNIC